jgi:hypothetical protein
MGVPKHVPKLKKQRQFFGRAAAFCVRCKSSVGLYAVALWLATLRLRSPKGYLAAIPHAQAVVVDLYSCAGFKYPLRIATLKRLFKKRNA